MMTLLNSLLHTAKETFGRVDFGTCVLFKTDNSKFADLLMLISKCELTRYNCHKNK